MALNNDLSCMLQSRAPRANADPEHLTAKMGRLSEPHLAPLTRFLRETRAGTGSEVVDFNPDWVCPCLVPSGVIWAARHLHRDARQRTHWS
jgi:hypothetical protein